MACTCVCEYKKLRPQRGVPYSVEQCRCCWLALNGSVPVGGVAYGSSSPRVVTAKEDKPCCEDEGINVYTCHRKMARLIDGPAREWPLGWKTWQNTGLAHRLLAKAHYASQPPYPEGRFSGRGVVISGGGKYWPGVWVTCRMLRHVGCTYPIQVWYLGERGEASPSYQKALEPFGVECIDADQVRKVHPWRILNGFESKLYSVFHSPFEDVLYLDADSYPVKPLDGCWDDPEYQRIGGIYFADMPKTDSWTNWGFWGVERFGPPCGFETGQYWINKRLAWGPLWLATWYDQHSDWCYGPVGGGDYGDKGPHRIAWAQLRRPPIVWQIPSLWVDEGLCFAHKDREGHILFVHRCRGKFAEPGTGFYTPQNLGGPQYCDKLPLEKEAWRYFHERPKQ